MRKEDWKHTHLTKQELSVALAIWFHSKQDEWSLFTLTVVFKAGGRIRRPARWEGEYRNRVLMKIERVLERNKNNRENAIPYKYFYEYEFDETSIFKKTESRKPHHIHALIPIRKSNVRRFWSEDSNSIQPKLLKDIESINTVQSIDIQRIEIGDSLRWIRYCQKGKYPT